MTDGVRLDRWLWAARFHKTRAKAKTAIDAGHVTLNGHRAKPSKEVAIGATITVRRGETVTTVIVRALSEKRASATIAAALYDETPESIETREALRARRRMERAGLRVPITKPDKRGRRALQALKTRRDTPE
ncbi:MAG: S4 domain-containing protein [Pseudomonadales bacterium]|jgi:ribosome-associated heat shock protein Hsp15|nr:S4 domain-containing protein [Pseudomonadales bacterium]MDP6469855.1 S4 domain-containing protein [Pseudomonadales bacterium]MDP6827543.1 S4 domain-containing protein [Pseudomonadales bacterium]MDP6971325.1 S4 domain-containing protein [Pseudomonadales bacterium]|tara:strand:+ start:1917 stop:2312 length:396 start_codon:yes stop_codon:yes gene_type:complete